VLQACERFGYNTIRFPSARGLQWDPRRLCRTFARWDISLFHPADRYSYLDATKPIPFDSPRSADSNGPCPDAVRPLVVELSKHLYLSSPRKYIQIVGYWVLQACGRFETYTIRFPSTGGFQRTLSRCCPTAGWMVMHTFVHEFPEQVLSHCWLLGARGMRTLWGLYYSIPLGERTPMRPFPTLADICPLRPLPLHPADLYSHADTSKPIPFDSPRPADSNGPCPDAVRPLVEWVCILLYLSFPGKYFQIVSYGVLLFSRLALINIYLF